MQRLLSRQKQIPNGFTFRQSQINWDSRRVLGMHPSFDTLVSAVLSARRANAAQSAQHKLSLDRASVEMEVEMFNVKVCLANGWMNYLTEVGGGSAVPLSVSRSPEDQKKDAAAAGVVKKLWAGLTANKDWIASGEPAVPSELSTSRALTCSECPQNKKGDWSSWFTIPAVAAIKRYMAWLSEKKLSTPHDDKVQVCDVCYCPLAYKVHTPLKFIKANTSPEVYSELRDKGKACWVVAEIGQ